jgi:hypothetical protein
MTFKQIKLAWGMVKPLLSAAGITKPQDLRKITAPVAAAVEKLVKYEHAQANAQQEIADALKALSSKRDHVEIDLGRTKNIRTQLEQVLRD